MEICVVYLHQLPTGFPLELKVGSCTESRSPLRLPQSLPQPQTSAAHVFHRLLELTRFPSVLRIAFHITPLFSVGKDWPLEERKKELK